MPLLNAQDQARAADIIDRMISSTEPYSESDAQWLAWNIPCDGKILDIFRKQISVLSSQTGESDRRQTTGYVAGKGNVSVDVPKDNGGKRQPALHWIGDYEVCHFIVPTWLKVLTLPGAIKHMILGEGAFSKERRPFTELTSMVKGRMGMIMILPRHYATKSEIMIHGLAYKVAHIDGEPQCTTVAFARPSLRSGPKRVPVMPTYPDWMHTVLGQR